MTEASSPYKWYIIQAYAGYEEKVKLLLNEQLKINKMEELVQEIFIPSEEVTTKKGEKVRKTKVTYFPGYILIKMHLTQDLGYVADDVPKVLGQVHLDQDVARKVGDLGLPDLLALFGGNLFGRDKNLLDQLFHFVDLELFVEQKFHLLFIPGVGLDDVPLVRRASFGHFESILSNNLFHGLGEPVVNDPQEYRGNQGDHQDHAGLPHGLFSAGPANLFEFAFYFGEKTSDPFKHT